MKRKRAPTSESAFPCARHERKRLRDGPELFFCNKEASLAAGAAALPYGADTGPRCSDCAGGAGGISTLPRDPYFPFPPEKPRYFAFLACDAMVTSFHFPGRPGKERSQRKGAAGQAKNKRAAHTIRPAPTPGPLTLALAFLIHSGGRIKGSLVCVHSSLTRLCPPCHL